MKKTGIENKQKVVAALLYLTNWDNKFQREKNDYDKREEHVCNLAEQDVQMFQLILKANPELFSMVKRFSCNPVVLTAIWPLCDDEVQTSFASYKSLPLNLLEELVTKEDPKVAMAILQNPNCSIHLINKLCDWLFKNENEEVWTNEHKHVLCSIANNPQTPQELVVKIFHAVGESYRHNFVNCIMLPPHEREIMYEYAKSNDNVYYLWRKDVTLEEVRHFVETQPTSNVVISCALQKFPSVFIKEFAEGTIQEQHLGVLECSQTTLDIVSKFVNSDDTEVSIKACKTYIKRSTGIIEQKVFEKIISFGSLWLEERLLESQFISPEQIDVIVSGFEIKDTYDYDFIKKSIQREDLLPSTLLSLAEKLINLEDSLGVWAYQKDHELDAIVNHKNVDNSVLSCIFKNLCSKMQTTELV